MNQKLVIIIFCIFLVLSCRTYTINRTYPINRTYTLTGTITQKETGRAPSISTVIILRNNVMILRSYNLVQDSFSNDMKNFCFRNLEQGNYKILVSGDGYDPKITTIETKIGNKDTTHIAVITSYSRLKLIPGQFNGICPICNKSDSLRKFFYGLPSSSGWKRIKKENLILGGCMMSDKNPKFRCLRDSVDFR